MTKNRNEYDIWNKERKVDMQHCRQDEVSCDVWVPVNFFRSYQPDEPVLKSLEGVLFWKLEKDASTKVLLKKQQRTENTNAEKQQEQLWSHFYWESTIRFLSVTVWFLLLNDVFQ